MGPRVGVYRGPPDMAVVSLILEEICVFPAVSIIVKVGTAPGGFVWGQLEI